MTTNTTSTTKKQYKDRQALVDMLHEALEKNCVPWRKPWKEVAGSYPFNFTTEKPYRGANAMILDMRMSIEGWTDPRWATFKQVQAMSKGRKEPLKVAKGSKGQHIGFYTEYDKTSKCNVTKDHISKIGHEEYLKRRIANQIYFAHRTYVVFNGAQIEGLEAWQQPEIKGIQVDSQAIEKMADGMSVNLDIRPSNRAFYNPGLDKVQLPLPQQFDDPAEYYSTALHELSHATGHKSRLNRDIGGRFGSQSYALEEMKAEIAAFFLQREFAFEVSATSTTQNAAYIKSWQNVIKNDPDAIVKAMADAQKIADYISKAYESGNPSSLLPMVQPPMYTPVPLTV